MRLTCTSSSCSPWGPSASVTVQRSSFEALLSKQKVTYQGRRCCKVPAPYSEPANVAIVVLGAERKASEGEAPPEWVNAWCGAPSPILGSAGRSLAF